MAAAVVSEVTAIFGALKLAKNVYERVKEVNSDFKKSKVPLLRTLEVLLSTLEEYEQLEEDGVIKFEEKGKGTSVGIAISHLRESIEETENYVDGLHQKSKLGKVLDAEDINKELKSLTDEVSRAANLLSQAMQPIQMKATIAKGPRQGRLVIWYVAALKKSFNGSQLAKMKKSIPDMFPPSRIRYFLKLLNTFLNRCCFLKPPF